MKKYYIEITDLESGDFMFQSKWLKSPRTAEKWIAENVDHIDFINFSVFIMVADFDEEGCFDNIRRYSYIDGHIFANLKEKYRKGEKK